MTPGVITDALELELLDALLVLRQLKWTWRAIGYSVVELTPLISVLKRADVAEGTLILPAPEEALSGKTMTQGVQTCALPI